MFIFALPYGCSSTYRWRPWQIISWSGVLVASLILSLAVLADDEEQVSSTPRSDASPVATNRNDLTVFSGTVYTRTEGYPQRKVEITPDKMIHAWLMRSVNKALKESDENFEKLLRSPDQIPAYQERMRKFYIDQIGGLPEKTPLNAKVVEKMQRDAYRVEKVIFESQPHLYVTALLFLPMTKPPYPGVIVPCGHTSNGKAGKSYQLASILLAKNGMAALCYDPIDQGERHYLDDKGRIPARGAYGHDLIAVSSMLLGRDASRFWVIDAMRAVDYLQSRPDIDPERIGCTGNSGGGTATTYAMGVDPRIKCAAPSCFITSTRRLMEKFVGSDGEQHIHSSLAYGLGHPEFIIMRCPLPTLICSARYDYYFAIDGAWDTFRRAKQIYGLRGYPERVDMVESLASHGFSTTLRVGAVRWMRRWLLHIDDAITENPNEAILTDEEAQVTPDGEVMRLPGALSTYGVNWEYEKQLQEARRTFWASTDRAKALMEVRKITGIRKLADLPKCFPVAAGEVSRRGYQINRATIRVEPDLWLPALIFVPENPDDEAYLYLHQDGKQADAGPGGPIEKLVRNHHIVLAVDLPGLGETQIPEPEITAEYTRLLGHGWKDMFLAYELGKSWLTFRAEDILISARVLAQYRRHNLPPNRVHLISIGNVGPPALHAAALEPQLFASVTLKNCLVSWSDVIKTPLAVNQFVNAVFGALKVYDLPDLLGTLPKDKVKFIDPVDAMGKPVGTNE